nr:hypothetical protein [Tanacetum cinerariifolium]
MHHGCGFLLGKVVEVRGSSVRVVEWAGKEGEWGYGAWREKQFGGEQYVILKQEGDEYYLVFGGFTKLVPGLTGD